MTRVRRHFLTLLLTLTIAAIQAQTSADIIGHWKDNEQPNRLVEFYLGDNNLYYARIARDDDHKDLNGKVFIKKLKYDDSSKSYQGLVSPPDIDANMEINATITWLDQDTLLIVVKNFFNAMKIRFERVK